MNDFYEFHNNDLENKKTKIQGVYHAFDVYRLCIIELLHDCNTYISYYSKKEYFYILRIDSC